MCSGNTSVNPLDKRPQPIFCFFLSGSRNRSYVLYRVVAQLRKWGFLGSPRRFLILPGDRTEERPVFSYLQAGFFTLFQPKFSEILLKMGIFSL